MPAWLARMMQTAFLTRNVRELRKLQQMTWEYLEYQSSQVR